MAKRDKGADKESLVSKVKNLAVDSALHLAEAALDVADSAAEAVSEKIEEGEAELASLNARVTYEPKATPLITKATSACLWQRGEPYRILSMDGAAGVMQYVRLLRDLVKHQVEAAPDAPGFLGRTHMITGNSGGTLAALYLVAKLNDLNRTPTAQEEVEILDGLVAFTDEFFEVSAGSAAAVRRTIKGQQAALENEGLREMLKKHYGALRLGDCQMPATNILSFRMYNGAAPQNFFSPALTDAGSNEESNPSLVDLALRSSAFPLCLPMYQGHVDGALVANNPSLQTICRLRRAGREQKPPFLAGLTLDDIRLFSLGAEKTWLDKSIDFKTEDSGLPDDKDWGWNQWIGPLITKILSDEPTPKDIPKLIAQIKREAPQLVLFGEAFCDGIDKGPHMGCRNLLGDEPVFRLALPTTHGLIADGAMWWLGDASTSLKAAETRAQAWRSAPDDTSLGVSFHQTLSWLKEQWC